MRGRDTISGLTTLAALVALSACSPGAPPGVDRVALDAAVSRAIGDPATCVLIAKAGSSRVLYRYNTATACDRELPDCEGSGTTKTSQLLAATVKDGQPRTLSCSSATDAARGIGWASGPIHGTDLVYAAVMDSERAFPGRVIADRLATAFRKAKVSPQPQ